VFAEEWAASNTASVEKGCQMQYAIPTYCEYINKYILQAEKCKPCQEEKRKLSYVPGEHHFVAVYLLPRLIDILGIPHFVNPVEKGFAEDVVYCSYPSGNPPIPRLRIEVKWANMNKEDSFDLTLPQRRSICKEDENDKPDLFVGVSRYGVVIMPWNTFGKIYHSELCPPLCKKENIDPKSCSGSLKDCPLQKRAKDKRNKERNKYPADFKMSYFKNNEEWREYCFPYEKSDKKGNWLTWESKFNAFLRDQCQKLPKCALIEPLQPSLDM
jgi:hypothetical protein